MLRFLTAGESHGPGLTAILEGLPAGLCLSEEDIDVQLGRQKGFGSGGRMRIERDHVRFTGGLLSGRPPAPRSPCRSRTEIGPTGATAISRP